MDDTRIDRYFGRLRRLKYGKGKNNSDTGVSATMNENWIDRYFHIVQLRVGYRKQLIRYPRSAIKKELLDLEASLKMFSQEASCVADDWTDVNTKFDDRRSFPRFLELLKASGMDKYAFIKDNDINQPNMWLLSPDDDVVIADKYYGGSLSLIKLLQRIRSEYGDDDFRHEQAKLVESFLNNLIKIQEEQRLVAYSFSEHLEQLRNFGDDDGDRHKYCSIILSGHPVVWIQKHVFRSLYIMSRESAWLLKTLKDSYFTSPSSKEDCNKILDIIRVFISKFKESKESLDQYLLDECCGFNDHIMQNEEILDDFGGCMKSLREQGVEKKSVAETLLVCFEDVLNMFYKSKDTCSSSLECASFSEAAKETSELINEAVEKLISVRSSDLTGGGSPLGCMVLWRILFESSLVNLRLDLIYEKHNETVNVAATKDQLDQTRLEIDKLLTTGESVLAEFVAMQKTVAEVTYMLGDAFVTGGAGMRGSSDPGTSSRLQDDQLVDFYVDDFPWDKHTVPVSDRRIGIDDFPRNINA